MCGGPSSRRFMIWILLRRIRGWRRGLIGIILIGLMSEFWFGWAWVFLGGISGRCREGDRWMVVEFWGVFFFSVSRVAFYLLFPFTRYDLCNQLIQKISHSFSLQRMPINIMPPLPPNILSNLIILLGNLQKPQVHIHNAYSLLRPHLRHRPYNRKCHLRHTEEVLLGPGCVDEDNATGIFEAAGCNG